MCLKQNILLRFAVFTLLLALVFGCAKPEPEPARKIDSEYMPLAVGLYQIYQITETVYENGPTGQTTSYQLKIEVTDSIPTGNGFYTYVLQRYVRNSNEENWQNTTTWSATSNNTEIVVQEGNVSFVKFRIPVFANSFWNGNLYNDLGEEEYTVAQAGVASTIGEETYSDIVEIFQNNETDQIVGNDVRKEVYARNVGLVLKSEEVITYCTNSSACINKQIIQEGFVKEQVLLSYGKN